MSPRYYHNPLTPVSTRVRCPVCHEAVYSRAGIHPQCAVRQADPPRPRKPKDVPDLVDPVAGADGEAGSVAVVSPPAVAILPVPAATAPARVLPVPGRGR